MIIDSFVDSKVMIEPEMVYGKVDRNDKVCIVTFSKNVIDTMIKKLNMKQVAFCRGINGGLPVYGFNYQGIEMFAFMAPVTSAAAATFLDEVRALTGASKYIVFGSCGVLNNDIVKNRLIVPTESYRDEGVSYHYAKASDYINMKNADKLAEIFEQLNVSYIKGKNWTIETLYRETQKEVDLRKSEGCICVEMEAAGLQALFDYRNCDFYTFFFGGDDLDCEDWDMANLGNDVEKENQMIGFEIALQVATRI